MATPTEPKQYASPSHQALAEYAAMLNSLPTQITVTVVRANPAQSLAASLRAVLANQSQSQGGQ